MADSVLLNTSDNSNSQVVLLNTGKHVLLNTHIPGLHIINKHATELIGPKPEQLIPVEFTFRIIATTIRAIESRLKIQANLTIKTKTERYGFLSVLIKPVRESVKVKGLLVRNIQTKFKLRSPLLKFYTISVNKPKRDVYEKRKQVQESEQKNLKNALSKLLKNVLEDDE